MRFLIFFYMLFISFLNGELIEGPWESQIVTTGEYRARFASGDAREKFNSLQNPWAKYRDVFIYKNLTHKGYWKLPEGTNFFILKTHLYQQVLVVSQDLFQDSFHEEKFKEILSHIERKKSPLSVILEYIDKKSSTYATYTIYIPELDYTFEAYGDGNIPLDWDRFGPVRLKDEIKIYWNSFEKDKTILNTDLGELISDKDLRVELSPMERLNSRIAIIQSEEGLYDHPGKSEYVLQIEGISDTVFLGPSKGAPWPFNPEEVLVETTIEKVKRPHFTGESQYHEWSPLVITTESGHTFKTNSSQTVKKPYTTDRFQEGDPVWITKDFFIFPEGRIIGKAWTKPKPSVFFGKIIRLPSNLFERVTESKTTLPIKNSEINLE